MDIKNIKYGNSLLKEKIQLEKNLDSLKEKQKKFQVDCNHIMLYFGSEIENRSFGIPGRECLFCRATEVEESYPVINVWGYKSSEIGFFSAKRQREFCLEIIQDQWIKWMEEDPSLSREDLIERLREEVRKSDEQNRKTEKRMRKCRGW